MPVRSRIAAAISASAVVFGVYVLWGAGVAIIWAACCAFDVSSTIAKPLTVFGPIGVGLYFSARW